MAHVGERHGQLIEDFLRPKQWTLGIAPRRWRDQTLEITEQRWIAIRRRPRAAGRRLHAGPGHAAAAFHGP